MPASGINEANGSNCGANISIPTASFTSTGDDCCETTTQDIFTAMPTTTPRLYRDLVGSSHLEPVLAPPIEQPYLATFTAAWLEIFLGGNTSSRSYEAIFGSGEGGVCGYAKMANCSVVAGGKA